MRVAVVGGGIAGLVAARALATAGHSPILLEREPTLGGKIQTLRRDRFLIEAGPDSFLATKPLGIELCRELGLERKLVGVREPRRVGVHARGRLIPLPEGVGLVPSRLSTILTSPLFTALERARIAADLVLPRRRPLRADRGHQEGGAGAGSRIATADESVGSLIRRRLGRAALDRLVAPLLSGIYAADPERLSVEATFPQLRRFEREHGSLIRGAGASERLASLRAPLGQSKFVTLEEGLSSLIARLADDLRHHDLRTSAPVGAIARSGIGYRLELDSGTAVEADGVVLATPAWEAARLLSPIAPAAASLLTTIPYASTAVVSLGYRARDLPPLYGHGFVVARDQPSPITASTWSSSKWPGRAPMGHALIRAYLGSAAAPVDLEWSDDRLIAAAREGLARALGAAPEPMLAVVHRWPAAMPQYTVGHLDRVARIRDEVGRLPGLALAGAAYDGVGIPDVIGSGVAAALLAAGRPGSD